MILRGERVKNATTANNTLRYINPDPIRTLMVNEDFKIFCPHPNSRTQFQLNGFLLINILAHMAEKSVDLL